MNFNMRSKFRDMRANDPKSLVFNSFSQPIHSHTPSNLPAHLDEISEGSSPEFSTIKESPMMSNKHAS